MPRRQIRQAALSHQMAKIRLLIQSITMTHHEYLIQQGGHLGVMSLILKGLKVG
jgi:hypothetical protein